MKEIAVFGEEHFTLGFALAGVNATFSYNGENATDVVKDILAHPEIGVVIIQAKILDDLDEQTRETVTGSIDPIFLTLSRQDTNEEMRRMIKKSIGVDMWNQ